MFGCTKYQHVYDIINDKGNFLDNYFGELRKNQKDALAAECREVSHESWGDLGNAVSIQDLPVTPAPPGVMQTAPVVPLLLPGSEK